MHNFDLIFGRYGIIHLVWRESKKCKMGFWQVMYDMISYALNNC